MICGSGHTLAQNKLIQVAGIVADSHSSQPLAFAQVINISTGKGTIADTRGYFSLVCREGDTLAFYHINYKPAIHPIRTGSSSHTHFVEAYLTRDTVRLSPTVVAPWSTYQAFKYALLYMDQLPAHLTPSQHYPLSPEALQHLAQNAPPEGYELQTYTLQEHIAAFYHAGQYPYIGLFNPFAWARFFQWLSQQKRASNR